MKDGPLGLSQMMEDAPLSDRRQRHPDRRSDLRCAHRESEADREAAGKTLACYRRGSTLLRRVEKRGIKTGESRSGAGLRVR